MKMETPHASASITASVSAPWFALAWVALAGACASSQPQTSPPTDTPPTPKTVAALTPAPDTTPASGDPWTALARQPATSTEGIVWQPFSEEIMAAARHAGRPVFLQYSAEWCKPCEVHEREYFSKPDIRQRFADSGVLPVKADMTEHNDLMEDWILRLKRMALPTYAVYYPDGSTDLLPMPLTRTALVAALERVPRP